MAIPVNEGGISVNPPIHLSALEINVPVDFTATVSPSNATYQEIVWTIRNMSGALDNGAATIEPSPAGGGKMRLTPKKAGDFILRATIANGKLT